MREILIIYVLCFLYGSVSAQHESVPAIIRAQSTLSGLERSLSDIAGGVTSGNITYGIPMPKGETIGDFYLDKNWNRISILLYQKDILLEGYTARWDIKNSRLEIRAKNTEETRALEIEKIKSMVWIDSSTSIPRYFVNAKDYDFNGSGLPGMFEVLVEGKTTLFKRTTKYVQKANYNIAMDVGSRDDVIIDKHEYYWATGGQVRELPRGRKMLGLFQDKGAEVKSYVKDKGLRLNKEEDIILLFKYYNNT
ncbi:MAG: hypothetical protein KIT62_01710 [Cyclobacteriaceae bacterium]|nr:hypothetical protein [Cyclobacteriaceae bacterium]